jgi:YHS domain-containing protein
MKTSQFFSFLFILQATVCILLAGAIVMVAAPAYGQTAVDSPAPQAGTAKPAAMNMGQPVPEGKVTKVEDDKKICMVTNKAYDRSQIPVTVDGKTYYGCCEMCKSMLTNNPDQRAAVDPVSKKNVDKSQAVIGVTANGGVIYFQNDKDLDTYNKKFASN